MSITKKLGSTLLIIISLLVSETTISSSLGDSIVGNYNSEITGSGGGIYSGVTGFFLDSNGTISGGYTFKQAEGVALGKLYNCTEKMEIRQVICNWKDKLGTGDMDINFSEDYKSFSGGWNFEGSSRKYPWNGKKQN